MNEPSVISPAERRVLACLKLGGHCEVKTLARSLRVTAMAVRYHLAELEKAGLVKTTLERGGVGRPHRVYALSARAETLFPTEYDKLASNLIRAITKVDGEAKLARLFEQMKKERVARYAGRLAGKPLRRRVAEMAKIMTEAGYMARWRQLNPRTFQITEYNCAIACVAHECQHACQAELEMLRELLQARVSREEHIVAGDVTCRYVIQGRGTRKSTKERKRNPRRI